MHRGIPLVGAGFIARAKLGIGDDPYDSCPRQSSLRVADVHTFADGLLTRPGMSGHGLVHDHHQRCVGAVVHGECSAIEHADAHGANVVAVSGREHGEFQLPTFCGNVLDGVGSARCEAGCGKDVGDTGGNDSGLADKAVDDGMVEGVHRSISRVLIEGQLIAGNEKVVRTESGVHCAHLLEASQKGAGYSEQHQGDGDFRDDQD